MDPVSLGRWSRVDTQRVEGTTMKDNDIRPASFDDYVGQRDVIATLRRAVVAALHNDRPCGHLLIAGMPGCGKTTLAAIVAAEMKVRLHSAVCQVIEHKGELTGLLTSLARHDVLFLDELHGLKPAMQELLYTAMEDGHVDLSAGKKTIRLPLVPFTLIGATTRAHLLTGPLRDRFAYTFNLGHYGVLDLAIIAKRTMGKLGLPADDPARISTAIGNRSRGTPRIVNRLVRACRDFMQSAGEPVLTLEIAEGTFHALGIDSLGLDKNDRAYLGVLCERVGAPYGVMAISAQLGLERGVIENVIEPHLLETGLIRRTPQGRIAMPEAVKHLQQYEQMHREEEDQVIEEITS
jgi:Holliday junction DNA helicase RuvB